MPLPAALYARTAVLDPAHPITAQIDALRGVITAHGWTLDGAHIFHDAGYSGLAFDRPGLTALRDALQRGEFVRLVRTHPERLSWRVDDRWLIENEAGCRIVDGTDGEMEG
jgi:DNA invertase Pin-like site-specific DNA recombinase